MPKMPGGDDGEKKEESAESREEAKEQVKYETLVELKKNLQSLKVAIARLEHGQK